MILIQILTFALSHRRVLIFFWSRLIVSALRRPVAPSNEFHACFFDVWAGGGVVGLIRKEKKAVISDSVTPAVTSYSCFMQFVILAFLKSQDLENRIPW